MRNTRPAFFVFHRQKDSKSEYRYVKRKKHLVIQLLKKFVCAVLIFSFLSLSTPAAPETLSGMASKSWQELRFRFLSSQLPIDAPNWLAFFAARKSATDSPADISRIQIYPAPSSPGPMRLEKEQEVVFAAVAFDANNEPLSGIDFRWSAVDHGSNQRWKLSRLCL
mgnify:CR=1 FL=1